MTCIPSFIKISSAIQKVMWEGIHRQHSDRISLLLCVCVCPPPKLGKRAKSSLYCQILLRFGVHFKFAEIHFKVLPL
jgi:hypothetical protein